MAVSTFKTQFDKMTTTKDRLETRTRTAKTFLTLAYIQLICIFVSTFYFLLAIARTVVALSCAIFFGLGATISRIRLADHRRHIAKTLFKQYQA